MNNEILFAESQKFRQWWVWLFLVAINGIFIYGVILQVFAGRQFGDNPMSDAGLVIVAVLIILFSFLILSFRLDTKINREGIYVRFFPLQLAYRFYPWTSIVKCYTRQYSAIGEFGGWGIRGFEGYKALNVSGNTGLQLELTANKKLLIGTNKKDELEKILISHGLVKL